MSELFSQILDLKEKDVFLETEINDNLYFNITGLPPIISYGKHPFTITFNDPENQPLLKNLSNIIFEFVDSRGVVIFSNLVDIEELSGAGNGFVWIKKDPLRTADEIADGPAFFYVMGELDGQDIPSDWKGIYNIRSTFQYDIRKDYPNTSPLIISTPLDIQKNITISESIELDTDSDIFKRSFINVSLQNMETNGGKIESVELSYNEQNAKTDDFEIITTYPLLSGSFETTDQNATSGINPISNTTKIVTPKEFRRDTPVRFRLRFLNPAKQLAQHLDEDRQGEIIEITSSFITFDGSPFFIEKEDNLLKGSLFTGNAVGKGFEQSGKNSAFLKTVDYEGFESASLGLGSSGVMFFSGSVLTGSGDNYDGVGLELFGTTESFFRFRTDPSILDIRAQSFFVGSETTQFISGSGGQIEISSSLFHLDPSTSTLVMSGSISASSGQIGGWDIRTDKLVNSENTVELNSSTPGLNILDAGGTERVTIKSGSFLTIGEGEQYIGNKSFEEDSISVGRNIVNSATSWSFSLDGKASASLTDRSSLPDKDGAVSGDTTLDIIVPEGSENYASPNRYQIVQIITASFTQGDTLSFGAVARFSSSFGGKGKDRALGPQYFRVEYSSSNSDGFKPFLPASDFTASNGYGEYFLGTGQYNSFGASAEMPEAADFVRVVLSGSINDDSGYTIKKPLFAERKRNKSLGKKEFSKQIVGSATPEFPETEITFDNFSLRSNTRKVELTEKGLLIYNSEDSFLKMDATGIEFRGGSGVSAFGSSISRESFTNDSDVAGRLGAPALQPYSADPEDIGTSAFDGNVGEFAKGNHRHRLTVETVNSVLNGQDIQLGSLIATGSITAQGDIIAENYIVRSNVTQITQSFSSGSTIFGDTLDDTHQFTGSLLVSSSNITIDNNGDISAGVITATSFDGNFIGALSSSAQISDEISGSFIEPSASLSLRTKNLEAASSSFSTRTSDLEEASSSFSTRTTNLEVASASISSRLSSEEANVDELQSRQIITGLGLTGGGNLTADRTLTVDFSDTNLQTTISGSFLSTSSSIASDIAEFKDGTINLISGSSTSTGSFGQVIVNGVLDVTKVSSSLSTRISIEEANVDELQTDSGSFSTRITNLKNDSGSFSTRISNLKNDSGSFSTRISNLKNDSGSFSTRVTLNEQTGSKILNGELPFTNITASNNVSINGDLKLGDNLSDSHLVTGSLSITGSFTVNGGGVATTPGNDKEVVFNDGGVLGSTTNFTFDKTTNHLSASLPSTASFGKILQNGETLASVGGADTNVLINTGGVISGSGGFVYDDSTNRVGIGTTSPARKLEIKDTSSNVGIRLTTGTALDAIIDLGDTGDADVGQIRYDNNTDKMHFRTNASDRLTIDSSGNIEAVTGNISGSVTSTGSFGVLGIGGGSTPGTNNIHVYEGGAKNARISIEANNVSYNPSLNLRNNNADGQIELDYRASNRGDMNFYLDNDIGGALGAIMALRKEGHVEFIGANQKISGSSTSTGSFGRVFAKDSIQIGGPSDVGSDSAKLVIDKGSNGTAAISFGRNNGADIDWTIHTIADESLAIDGIRQGEDLLIRPAPDGGSATEVLRISANGNKISGSSTSTGSFGVLKIADDVAIGTVNSEGAQVHIKTNPTSNDVGLTVESGDAGAYVSFKDNSSSNWYNNRVGAKGNTLVLQTDATDRITLENGGDVVFNGANQKISGSSTSTGSFGSAHIADKVGIGTTSPIYALHVEAGNDLAAKFSNDGDRSRILINDNDTEGYIVVQNSLVSIGQQNSLSADNLNIDGSGNIGIGTTSPDAPLELTPGAIGTTSTVGGLSINDGLKINTTSGRSGVTVVTSNDFLDTSTNAAFQFLYPYDDTSSSNDKTYKAFRIAHGSDITGSGDSFSVDKFGNVLTTGDISGSSTSTGSFGMIGINTASPSNTLHAFANVSNKFVALIENDQASSGHGLKVHSDGGGTGTILLDLDGNDSSVFRVLAEGTTTIGGSTTIDGNVSGSATSTGSFGNLTVANDLMMPNGRVLNWGTSHGTLGSAIVGNSSTNVLVFYTNGSERARFNSSGNLGIGTTNPNTELTVKNSANNSDFIRGENAGGGRVFSVGTDASGHSNLSIRNSSDTQVVYLSGDSSVPSRFASVSGSSTSTGSFGALVVSGKATIGNSLLTGFDDEANDLIVGDGTGDSGLTIYSGQNVGDFGSIHFADGTSSTAAKAGYIKYEQNTSAMTFGINGVTRATLDISGHFQPTGNISGSSTSTGSFGDGRFSGKLGINTTAPTARLDVNGSARVQGQLLGKDGNASSPAISFNADANTGIFRIGSDNIGISTAGTQRIAVAANNTEFSTGIVSTKANGLISGSSTSTGSFGRLQLDNTLLYDNAILDVGRSAVADPTVLIDSATGGDPQLIFDTGTSNRTGIIQFKDEGTVAGFIKYEHNGDKMNFGAASSTSVRLTVSEAAIEFPTANVKVSGSSSSTGSFASGFFADSVGIGVNPAESRALKVVGNVQIGDSSDTSDYLFFQHNGTDGRLVSNRGKLKLEAQSSAYVVELVSSGISGSSTSTGSFGALEIAGDTIKTDSGGRTTFTGDNAEVISVKSNNSNGSHIIFEEGATARGYVGIAGGILTSGGDNFGIRSEADLLFATNGNNTRVTINSAGVTLFEKTIEVLGQNLTHGASRLKISQENTGLSEFRFYGADTSTAGSLRFLGSSSDGVVGGTRMTIASSGNVGIGTASPSLLLTIADDGDVGTNTFISGVAGDGFRIKDNGSSGVTMEIDNVFIRNTLRTHIFQKDTVKATNGILFISDSGVISGSNGSDKVTFINSKSATFSDNTQLLYKDIDESTGDIREVRFTINGSGTDDGTHTTYDVDNVEGSLAFLTGSVGATAVRISGGSLALDASSPNSPFMDVNSSQGSGSTVVRVGNLDGITSPRFGTLDGFGLWASGSAYLEGNINAKHGNIGGWGIGETAISSSGNNISIDAGINRITITDGSADRIYLGEVDGNGSALPATDDQRYGLKIFDGSGTTDSDLLVELGEGQNMIVGWDLTPGNIQSDNADGSVRFSSTKQALSIFTGSIDDAQPKLVLGKLPINDGTVNQPYGLAVFDGVGNVTSSVNDASASVLITANKARLAGWELVPGRLKSGTVADINGNNASIALGTNATTATGTPTDGLFFVSASTKPVFYVGSTFSYVNDVLKAGGWEIGNGQISASTGTAQIISSNGGAFALGTTPPTNYENGTGVFLSGSGQALFGNAAGSRVQWTGTALRISSSAFNLTTDGNVTASNALFENVRIVGGTTNNEITPFNFSDPSFIGGGNDNKILGATNAFMGGGEGNRITGSSAEFSALVGGEDNLIDQCRHSAILGGSEQIIEAAFSAIGGGRRNEILFNPDNSNGYNFIGGGLDNIVSQSQYSSLLGTQESTIKNSTHSSIVGGRLHKLEDDSLYSIIGGGNINEISRSKSSGIFGGQYNLIRGDLAGTFDQLGSFIVGGHYNTINSSHYSLIGGGVSGSVLAGSDNSIIVGGFGNKISQSRHSSIVVGKEHLIRSGSNDSFIGGGVSNELTEASSSFIGGGRSNLIQRSTDSLIAGGFGNAIDSRHSGTSAPSNSSTASFIGGGIQNTIDSDIDDKTFSNTVIVGGAKNTIRANPNSFLGGGTENTIDGDGHRNVIVGGRFNAISLTSTSSFIGGGELHRIQGSNESAIVAGRSNTITGSESSFIGGGNSNTIQNSQRSTILSGQGGSIEFSPGATLVNAASSGAPGSNIFSGSEGAIIGGGFIQTIQRSRFASILGGSHNTIAGPNSALDSDFSTIAGGFSNDISSSAFAFIGAGQGVSSGPAFFLKNGNNMSTFHAIEESDFAVKVGGTNGILSSPYGFIGNGDGAFMSGSEHGTIVNGDGAGEGNHRVTMRNSEGAFMGSVGPDTHIYNSPGSFIGGGGSNVISGSDYGEDFFYQNSGQNNVIVGGGSNIIGALNGGTGGTPDGGGYSSNSFIGGGGSNKIFTARSAVVVGGSGNEISCSKRTDFFSANQSTIVGGANNKITSTLSFIGGGSGHLITDYGTGTASDNVIVGGLNNTIGNSQYSSILGGRNNQITGSNDDITIIGSNIQLNNPPGNTTYTENVSPGTDNSFTLGTSDRRWSDVHAVQTTTGGVFETGLRTKDIGKNPTGTIVSWTQNGLVPCNKNEDELVMGVIKKGKDEPIVMGAEPVLVTGKVSIGDYIVTSDKIGHGKAIKRGYLLKKDLFGKVIAQALESSDDNDSCLIKCMIRKM